MLPSGLEPETLRLLAVRSNQLSYESLGLTWAAPSHMLHGLKRTHFGRTAELHPIAHKRFHADSKCDSWNHGAPHCRPSHQNTAPRARSDRCKHLEYKGRRMEARENGCLIGVFLIARLSEIQRDLAISSEIQRHPAKSGALA